MRNRTFNRKGLKSRRKGLRTFGTPAEAVLWKHLQKSQVLGKKFRRQESIGPYIVDFYCLECRVIVELDGSTHDGFLTGEYDAERTKYFERYGFKVIRFENRVVFENLDGVLETIRQTLMERSSP